MLRGCAPTFRRSQLRGFTTIADTVEFSDQDVNPTTRRGYTESARPFGPNPVESEVFQWPPSASLSREFRTLTRMPSSWRQRMHGSLSKLDPGAGRPTWLARGSHT